MAQRKLSYRWVVMVDDRDPAFNKNRRPFEKVAEAAFAILAKVEEMGGVPDQMAHHASVLFDGGDVFFRSSEETIILMARRLLSNLGRGARDRVGGCGRIGGMQGTEKPDRELLDALGLCGALVREGSVYRFLAEHRLRLFPDRLFADLFGGRGRPSGAGVGDRGGDGVAGVGGLLGPRGGGAAAMRCALEGGGGFGYRR